MDPARLTTPNAVDRLRAIGFDDAGEWRLEDSKPRLDLTHCAAAVNALYAFASGPELLYVGRSRRALAARMAGYERGGPAHSTRALIHARIRALLAGGRPLSLLAMASPGRLLYGSFEVNLGAGLQHSLLEVLAPPWNAANTAATRPAGTAMAPLAGDGYTDLTRDRPGYRFLVGYHFLDKGYFNVPLRYGPLFGADKESIRILCGPRGDAIHGHIDRSTNTNAAPRVVGGRKLKRWFLEHAGLNAPVDIDILAPNAIWLRRARRGDPS